MSSKLLLSVFLVSFICTSGVYGATGIKFNSTHPDHPGKCYTKDTVTGQELILGIGESATFPKGLCIQIECRQHFNLIYVSCSPIQVDHPDCYIESDLNQDYPNCCGKIQCIDPSNALD